MKALQWIEGFSHAMVGWRKFIVAMFTIWAAWRLCAAGQLLGTGFVTTALGVLALFGATNVVGKFAPTVSNGTERS